MKLQYSKIRKGKVSIILVLFGLLFTSCGNLENIEIGDPEEFKIQGFEDNHLKVFARIPVNNPSIYNIRLQEIDVRVYANGSYIGKLIVDETILLKRNKSEVYELPIKVRLTNVLTAAFIMMNMKQGDKVNLRLEGKVTAKTMFMKREFPIDETKQIVI